MYVLEIKVYLMARSRTARATQVLLLTLGTWTEVGDWPLWLFPGTLPLGMDLPLASGSSSWPLPPKSCRQHQSEKVDLLPACCSRPTALSCPLTRGSLTWMAMPSAWRTGLARGRGAPAVGNAPCCCHPRDIMSSGLKKGPVMLSYRLWETVGVHLNSSGTHLSW